MSVIYLPETSFELRDSEHLEMVQSGMTTLKGRYLRPSRVLSPRQQITLIHQESAWIAKVLSVQLNKGKADVQVELIREVGEI